VASGEEPLPTEKVETPDCDTIEDLANFLGIPKEQTAKALLYTRQSDGKLVFAVVRGDMQLSEAKLKEQVGEIKMADYYAMETAGAVPGYAAPIDLKDTLIIVDDLIPDSPNLVTGANDEGYHLKNVNYGRDYSAEIVTDLVQASAGDACVNCGEPLIEVYADLLKSKDGYSFDKILHALAETHHDDNGLTLPHPAAPFDVYLMNILGKTMDTSAVANDLYDKLSNAGISVLFDDRDGRAGVKFNDADLIGPPVRVTIGERGLQNGNVELKPRIASKNGLVSLTSLTGLTSQAEFWDLVDNLDL
jgi:prolyl-tRNA synthetase